MVLIFSIYIVVKIVLKLKKEEYGEGVKKLTLILSLFLFSFFICWLYECIVDIIQVILINYN
jgi:hypothetical protein